MEAFNKLGRDFMTYPTSKRGQLMFKLPLILWRLGLGPLLGHYLLVITTKGRKSGLPRHTMTEFHTLNGKIYAPCAYGRKAQWYKNIAADPHVTVQTWQGAERMIATRVTDDEELLAVLQLVTRNNPVMLGWYLDSLGISPESEDIVAHKDRIYLIRFDPTDALTPVPLEVDLAWIWPVAMLVMLMLRRKHNPGNRSRYHNPTGRPE